MEVYRISRSEYSKKLSSSGVANRWNFNDQHVIYTGCTRSLSTFELVVHRNAIKHKVGYKVLIIAIPDDESYYKEINIRDLPIHWRGLGAYSALQQKGSDWYESQESLILKVPSAVIPSEYNFIINMEHPDFKKKVFHLRNENYFWNARLLKPSQ
jgi:RES domain-containing protein